MGRTLPALGVAGAVAAAVAALGVFQDALSLLVPIFCLAASVFLFLERTRYGAMAGGVAALLSILAILGLLGSVSTKKGGVDFGISEDTGLALAVVAALAIPASVAGLRWVDIEPEWMRYATPVAAVVAAILAGAGMDQLGNQQETLTLATAVLCLAAMASCIPLLRNPPPSAPPAPAPARRAR